MIFSLYISCGIVFRNYFLRTETDIIDEDLGRDLDLDRPSRRRNVGDPEAGTVKGTETRRGIENEEVVRAIKRGVIEENGTGIVRENGNIFTHDYLNLKQSSMQHYHFPLSH